LDLSYAAAHQLGMLEKGVAHVRIESIDIPEHAENQENALYVQVLASRDPEKANQIGDGLSQLFEVAASTVEVDGLYKVRLGPVKDRMEANILMDRLKQRDYHQAFVVTTP
jgi:rare lipoprotein A